MNNKMDPNSYNSRTGKRLLQSFTSTMYSDARMIFREYIQNSVDAINDAISQGLLNSIDDSIINIEINKQERFVVIEDNGVGIAESNVAPYLKDLGNSKKDGITTAGYFGLGRFMGAGFCERLTFCTSYFGEERSTSITFNATKIAEAYLNKNDNREATKIIDDESSIQTSSAKKEEHYFKVILENVTNDDLLDEEKISYYLTKVAPLPYSVTFQNLFELPEEYKEFETDVRGFNIIINDAAPLRKSYSLNVKGGDFEEKINSLRYFKLENNNILYAWGWFSVTSYKGQLVSDENKGLRLRMHNIAVGDERIINSIAAHLRDNEYFVGEIHIKHDKIKPTTERDNLANSIESNILKNEIKKLLNKLEYIFKFASDIRSILKRLKEAKSKNDQGSYATQMGLYNNSIKKFDDNDYFDVKNELIANICNSLEISLDEILSPIVNSNPVVTTTNLPKTPSPQRPAGDPITSPTPQKPTVGNPVIPTSPQRPIGGPITSPTPQKPIVGNPITPPSPQPNPKVNFKPPLDALVDKYDTKDILMTEKIFNAISSIYKNVNPTLAKQLQAKIINELIR